jgi:hypothetical protein
MVTASWLAGSAIEMRSAIRMLSLAVPFTLLVTVACGRDLADVQRPVQPGPVETPTRDVDAWFQTDSLSYTLSNDGMYTAKITVEFTNKTAATTYVANCNGISAWRLEKLTNGQWNGVWTAIIPSCASRPIAVAPNAIYKPAVQFYAGLPGTNVVPKFDTYPIDGIYRMVWTSGPSLTLVDTFSTDNLLPLSQRTSNVFALRTRTGP